MGGRLSFAYAIPYSFRGEDRNGKRRCQGKQVVVAGDQRVGFAHQRQFEERPVEGIAAVGNDRRPGDVHRLAPRQVIRQEIFSLIPGQAKLRIKQHPDQFLGRSKACQWADGFRLPRMA